MELWSTWAGSIIHEGTKDYSLKFREGKAERGHRIRGWQDQNGHWWSRAVEKDTDEVFKALTNRIDAPSRCT